MLKYRITKKQKDILDCSIETSGLTRTFTLRDAKNDIASLEKMQKEVVANAKLKRNIMDLVSEQNPTIMKFTEKERLACYVYVESKIKEKELKSKLNEIKAGLKSYTDDLAEIQKQLGIKI